MNYQSYCRDVLSGNRKKIKLLITGLYIGPGSFGGVVNFNKDLIKHLDKDYFDVHFFSLGKNPSYIDGLTQYSKRKYYLSLLAKVFRFVKTIRWMNVDVVHLNSGMSSRQLLRDGFFSILAKIQRRSTFFVIHGWKDDQFQKMKEGFFSKRLLSFLFQLQDRIGVSSEEHKIKLIDFGIDNSKMLVFTNMVETSTYFTEIPNEVEQVNLLFCAQPLKKEKGVNEFLESLPNVVESFPNCRVTIMGGELELFKTKASRLNLNKWVDFVGYVPLEEKIQIFQQSHILVFPSYTEGFPKTVLEAMASSMAIITTPVGGLAKVIESGRNGFFINSMPPNPAEIADLIVKLCRDKEMLNNFMINNLSDVRIKFDADIVINKFANLYCSIC